MEKIPQNLYFTILEHLYTNYGVNVSADVSDVLFKYFESIGLIEFYWNLKEDKIKEYLDPMQDEGHIRYHTSAMPKNEQGKGGIEVNASITAKGMVFYYQKLQIDSVLKTNRSVIENNKIIAENSKIQTASLKRQTFIFLLAAVFAFGSFAVSYISLTKSDATQQLQWQLKQLQHDTAQLRKQLSRQKMVIPAGN